MEAHQSSLNQTADPLGSSQGNLTYSPYYQHSLPVAVLYIVAYLLIFALCVVGNSLVCFVVLKNKQMRTVTNLFILNLAISDLLVGIFCVPTTLVDNLITGERRGGETLMCNLYIYCHVMFICFLEASNWPLWGEGCWT
ncbi:hypothetical protein JRQ81_011020 [Phrynocephalus forsythii]|uniref:G-protein coupled receptors family 1 profile domain-containing protein n=1 Tax=Phrynocephalus forsythii TaxID=171643 RepID=A0A9Q0X7R4_9SAUR|nr:hypothetical protein JRQ81_011020 [Phrynocephalus forsythii]